MKPNSKARLLNSLKLTNSKIPFLQIFKCKDYLENQENILNIIKQKIKIIKLLFDHHLIMKTLQAHQMQESLKAL